MLYSLVYGHFRLKKTKKNILLGVFNLYQNNCRLCNVVHSGHCSTCNILSVKTKAIKRFGTNIKHHSGKWLKAGIVHVQPQHLALLLQHALRDMK